MLAVNRRRKLGISFDEIYFVDDYQQALTDADLSVVIFCGNYPPRLPHKIKGNIGIDLSQPVEKIFAGFSRAFRQDIRNSIRDDYFLVERRTKPDEKELEAFCEYFNEFSRQKSIHTISRGNLEYFIEADSFLYTKVLDKKTGQPLCFLTYILHKNRASGQFGCSHFRLMQESAERNKIGKANKYLHYQNMLYFKEKGYSFYDFGGYHADENGDPLTGIDRFKKYFGGVPFTEYAFFYPRTLAGKLVLSFKKKHISEL